MGAVFPSQTRPKRYIPRHKKHEESIQRRACSYLRKHWPHAIFRSDYASGLHLTKNQAIIHASMQSGRAFPDLFVYEPMTVDGKFYCGLALEIKKEGTAIIVTRGPRKGHLVADKHIQEQYYKLKELEQRGYCVAFTIGYDATVRKLEWYLSGGQENATLF